MWLGGCKFKVVEAITCKKSLFLLCLTLFLSSSFAPISAQATDVQSLETSTSTAHDAAVAMGLLPFSIASMKTEAVVLTDELVNTTAPTSAPTSQQTQQIMGRSAFASPDLVASQKLSSNDLLKKVVQPPTRQDFQLNGSVAYLGSSRSAVVENFGIPEAPDFYDVEKLIFDQNGYLVAQKTYYNPEDIPEVVIERTGNWFSRLFRRSNNQVKEVLSSDAAVEYRSKVEYRLKIEGCYGLDIDFVANGFDCFDEENRVLYVQEWSPEGKLIKKDSYQLHPEGVWIDLHLQEDFINNTRIERHYDVSANLVEFKRFDNLADAATPTEHIRFFYNESGQRTTEAVLNRAGRAVACKFLIYGPFDTLELINHYSVRDLNQSSTNDIVDEETQFVFRSPLTEQSYTCEKEIPSILKPERSSVMEYGWLYDANDQLAGRRKQEISHYDAKGNLEERTIFLYADDVPTTLVAINKYDARGQARAAINFEYDGRGRLVKEERWDYGTNGANEAGRLLEQSNYEYQGREQILLEKTTEDYEHSRSKSIQYFDEAGNVIREQRFELFNRFGILNNFFRKKSDVSKSYTGRSFVREVQAENGNMQTHEHFVYRYDYAENSNTILNWIQRDEGSYVDKFDKSYPEVHHTTARRICYYVDGMSDLICNSPFD